MTDKDLNKAIATKLGWKPIPSIPGREHLFEGYMLKPDAKSEHDIDKVPDFTGSLDAMNRAENWCRHRDIFSHYGWALQEHFVNEEGASHDEAVCEAIAAIPKVRAKVFARITGILPVAGKEVEG